VNEHAAAADGQDHQLDARVIALQRITGGLFALAVSLASLIAIGINMLAWDDAPVWAWVVRPALWLLIVVLLALLAWRWPPIDYRHTSYRVDDQGIEIRRGVHWRVVINVPRSRVQHIDVSQGPLERRYGLGTLVIYTAGSDHAKVELAGLDHGRALMLRDFLLPTGSADAV
jgi:membrane protein YdbS with pleckstrin-like domain